MAHVHGARHAAPRRRSHLVGAVRQDVARELAVDDEDSRGGRAAPEIRAKALEEAAAALVRDDVPAAVERAAVDALLARHLALHLQPAADGVEG